MKTLLLLITLFAFLQSAFLPVNLVLVLLIARSLIIDDRENLYLAFFGGLILSFLAQINLGYYPILFLVVVKLSGMLKLLPVSFNLLMVFLSGALIVALTTTVNRFIIGQYVEVWPHLIEVVLVIPTYFFVKLWEERFVVKSHMKLKMR